jgi:prephenate dehydrogenase
MKPTVAIVGLGQIGGSLAAALTGRKLARVIGITRRAKTARRALKMRLLEAAGTELSWVGRADVVVLATPVRTLLGQIPRVAPQVRPGALLTDVGSTKKDIVEAFRRVRTPATVVAGHPMAGNERAGLDGVDPGLFVGRPWILIPGSPRDRRAAGLLERLVRGVGAQPRWMKDPLEHDLIVARVSHIPYLLAYALLGASGEAIRSCGNSFRDATRVAASEVEMVLDFLLTNKAPIRRAGRELISELTGLLDRVESGDDRRLRKALAWARQRRLRI